MNRALVFALLYVAAYIFLEWVTDVRPLLTPGITPVSCSGQLSANASVLPSSCASVMRRWRAQ